MDNNPELINPEGGDLLRYTYCTPDFVMGSIMVPALPVNAWAQITSQNRWEGVIFAGNRTARIYPQPVGRNHQLYNANWSVQSKGVMIEQRLKAASRGMWLQSNDEFSPVIIEVAMESDYPDFAAFQKPILANPNSKEAYIRARRSSPHVHPRRPLQEFPHQRTGVEPC